MPPQAAHSGRLIGGDVRFMDDVVLALAVSCEKEEILAKWWIELVCGSGGYPSPIKLEVEDRSSSYKSAGPWPVLRTSFIQAHRTSESLVFQ